MKWPEEERNDDEHGARYRKRAQDDVDAYRGAPWRKSAVVSVRKLPGELLEAADLADKPPRTPDEEALGSWLRSHGLPEAAAAVSSASDDGESANAMMLLAESAGLIFCSHPTVPKWRMIGQAIDRDLAAHKVLIELVTARMANRPSLRQDIRAIAMALVRDSVEQSAGATYESNAETYAALVGQWRAGPNLKEIWFGLRGLQYVTPFRTDWHIFDLLFEIDATFAAKLIEAYDEPFQPALILQWGALNPHRRFVDWRSLVELALPAFEASGEWNGRILLPLLLMSAQSAIHGVFGATLADREADQRHDTLRLAIVEAVRSVLLERSDGAAAALRWGGWLFRSMMGALDRDGASFPAMASSRARPTWLMLDALARSSASLAWLQGRPPDMPPEEELCVEAMRILAASTHDRLVPGRDLLLEMLPESPEEFLDGAAAQRLRELPGIFVTFGKRADAVGFRVLALSLLDEQVVETYQSLWRRTLTLREIVEHGEAFRSEDTYADQGVRNASETIRFVVALGINLIDYIQDSRQAVSLSDRRATAQALFTILHDATREMAAIDVIGRRDLSNCLDHLVVRRFVFEELSDERVAAPLELADEPTAGMLLQERCEVSPAFFGSLQMLRANGVEPDRMKRALDGVGISLDRLVGEALRLNAVEAERRIDLTGFEKDEA
jgi:hypothetical protein